MPTNLGGKQLIRLVRWKDTGYVFGSLVTIRSIDVADDELMETTKGLQVRYLDPKDAFLSATSLAQHLRISVDHEKTWSDGRCGRATMTNGLRSESVSWSDAGEFTSQHQAMQEARRRLEEKPHG